MIGFIYRIDEHMPLCMVQGFAILTVQAIFVQVAVAAVPGEVFTFTFAVFFVKV